MASFLFCYSVQWERELVNRHRPRIRDTLVLAPKLPAPRSKKHPWEDRHENIAHPLPPLRALRPLRARPHHGRAFPPRAIASRHPPHAAEVGFIRLRPPKSRRAAPLRRFHHARLTLAPLAEIPNRRRRP